MFIKGVAMSDNMMDVTCADLKEVARENPEEAAVIMQMLKDAGEDCMDGENTTESAGIPGAM